MKPILQKISTALGSRLARNIYLWIFLLYMVLELNINNEAAHRYGIIQSAWYPWIIIIGILLQMILLYGNNLWLVPRFLARKRYFTYFISAAVLLISVSVIYTVGLKTAKAYVDVDKLQQMGFVSSPVTTDWSFSGIYSEMTTYLFGNFFWMFIFTMAWYMNDYSRQRKLAEEARRQQTETELSFLKSQLNPHFLFNTLNNLYALTLKHSDDAPDAILKLSSILRYLLYESDAVQVSFEKEKEMMQAYIDLELLRLKDKDRLSFTISADHACSVAPLLWLPVLENIFKHGTRIIGRDNFVTYQYVITGNRLMISSVNNYKPGASSGKTQGIGLENLKKRLHLLFPGKHQIVSMPRGNEYITEVTIELS